MSTVFYALNGVYEDESEKSSTLKVKVCQKPRKMVKLDWNYWWFITAMFLWLIWKKEFSKIK